MKVPLQDTKTKVKNVKNWILEILPFLFKMEDSRFSKFNTDPKFRNVPKKQRKVQIDERFQSMFKDKKFVSKVSVDKRGRPGNYSTTEDYKKLYHLEKSDDDDDTDDDNIKDMGTAVKDPNVDYARGEAVLSDSSSEEEEGDDDTTDEDVEAEEEVEETDFDKWGELDHDAGRTDESTHRLAVCNMDWDRVGADDLFLALSSFCPPGGRLLKVSVYPSEFGKTRLAEEDQLGPVELRQESKRKKRKEESEAEAMERIRKYQVNRLKYYYAVAEFNSVKAADCVYSECNGTEYEMSAVPFDLRFIPDETQFEDDGPPRDICDAPPDPDKYKPKYFSSSALSLGKVDLNWDETDPERTAAMQKAFANDDDDDNLKAYFANSSDDDEEGEEESQNQQDDEHTAEKDEDVIAKYRALLGQSEKSVENEDENSDDDDGTGMEMTYIPEEDRKKQAEALKVEQMTPWEKYLHKKKEKRKQKKEERKVVSDEDDDDEDDDDIPSDVKNDPFFQEELKSRSSGKVAKKSNEGKASEDFSLLVMDSDDDKAHFDYKEIVKDATSSKRQKKRKRKNKDKQVDQAEDDFQMDVKDPRFAAIFHNPKYNVDPSHPGFKKTKAMKSIIEEKQNRIISSREKTPTEQIAEEPKMKKPKRSILSLADSVALKTSKKSKKKRNK